jgi:hypothetical protein
MYNYNPHNWYWIKADGTLYSSARGAEMSADDEEYQAWIAIDDNQPTLYPKDEAGEESYLELAKVLQPYGLGPLGEIDKLKNQLAATDYVTLKYTELVTLGDMTDAAYKAKYGDILDERAAARARINEIEAELEP